VREQFQLLITLQQVDDRLRVLALEEQALPQRLQVYEAACRTAREEVTQVQALIERQERQQRAFERELTQHQEAIQKTQSKAREVKTNKEHSAILTEIDAGKQRLAALEDQLLLLMEETEQQRQAQQEQEHQVQVALHKLAEQQQHVQQQQETVRNTIHAEQARRQQMVTSLDSGLYAQYQKVAMQQGGRSVAQIQEGVCSGCHLKLPPQLVSEIRLQTQLYTCPHCRLMLCWPA